MEIFLIITIIAFIFSIIFIGLQSKFYEVEKELTNERMRNERAIYRIQMKMKKMENEIRNLKK